MATPPPQASHSSPPPSRAAQARQEGYTHPRPSPHICPLLSIKLSTVWLSACGWATTSGPAQSRPVPHTHTTHTQFAPWGQPHVQATVVKAAATVQQCTTQRQQQCQHHGPAEPSAHTKAQTPFSNILNNQSPANNTAIFEYNYISPCGHKYSVNMQADTTFVA